MSSNPQHDPEAPQYGQYDLGLKSLVRSLQIAFFVMAALIVGLLVYFFAFGGFIIVNPQESVLVLRFGKVVRTLQNDWYWVFPRPVNHFVRIPLNAQSISVSFEAQKSPVENPEMAEGAPEFSPGRDNYLLTGDANIINASLEVIYTIGNPTKYYEKIIAAQVPFLKSSDRKTEVAADYYQGGPQVILQNTLRNVVIKVTAGQTVENALYKNKQAYLALIKSSFSKTIRGMDLGMEIQEVTFSKSPSPPPRTKKAFDEVIQAGLEKSKMIDDAQSYRVEQENSALSEKSMIVAEAENYRTRIVAEVQSESVYFDKINREYQQNPGTVLMVLYNNALSDVLTSVKEKYIIHKSARGNQEVRLKINPEPKEVNKKQDNQIK